MASLMNGSLITSRARVQRRTSALCRSKQLRQARAGVAGGSGNGEKLCNEEWEWETPLWSLWHRGGYLHDQCEGYCFPVRLC